MSVYAKRPAAPAADAAPSAPEWMPELARAEWDRVSAILAAKGRRWDVQVLERHSTAYATWREAEAEIGTSGRVIVLRDDKGVVKGTQPSPWVSISEKARAELTRTSRLLGL